MASARRPENDLGNRRVGLFSVSIDCTDVDDALARQVALLYGDYPLADTTAPPDIVVRPQWCRRRLPFGSRLVDHRVNGDFPFNPVPAGHSLPMIEIGLNWFIARYCTTHLLFHAAAVARDGKAILLPGASGAGKSTLSASLMAEGWQLLSDEFAILGSEDRRLHPHPRPVSLKEESIDVVARALPNACFSNRITGTAKGTIAYLKPSPDSLDKAHRSAVPVAVIFPRFSAQGAPVLKPLTKADSFMRLIDHSANYFTIMEAGFEALAGLVDSCPHYDFVYRSLDQAISEITAIHAGL